MSSTDAAANKRAALEQLKFNKSQFASRAGQVQSSVTIPSSSSSFGQPPAQSRDGTISSRFFPMTPPSMGTVLVPNSSPLGPDSFQYSYQAYQPTNGHDVAPKPSATVPNSRSTSSILGADPLSAPTGFTSNTYSINPSLRRPLGATDHQQDSGSEDGRPRKRLNRGPVQGAYLANMSPPSPDMQVAGRRRLARVGSSTSSDDSLPDIAGALAGQSKPRNQPGETTESSESPAAKDFTSDPKFIRFKVTMPLESTPRVEAAWKQAKGDVRRATELLSNPSWTPPSPTVPRVQVIQAEVGRVKEIDEATKAKRVAAREKGKKSMIYANRSILEKEPSQPAPSPTPKSSVEPPPASPTSPVITLPRKRLKKRVVDSDSDADVESDDERDSKRSRSINSNEEQALDYFNTSNVEALQELTGCTTEQAEAIINLRPFESIDVLNVKLGQGKKKAGPAGISPRLFEECTNIFEGYGAVDEVLGDCEQIGASIRAAIASWTGGDTTGKGKLKDVEMEDGALSLRSLQQGAEKRSRDYLISQPSLLSDNVKLKEYQLLGVNWLNLLYQNGLSCILADEMGLGKTIQVISFLAYLKEKGSKGPHLVVVPSSTLENWCREFSKFAPSIAVQTYYAGKDERSHLRQTLLDSQHRHNKSGWDVLITTYTLAQGDDRDRKFFKKIEWDACIFDEGHVLKNMQSQRYQALLKYTSRWRLLLTGTPLQNNLQELVSLMNFILPNQFADSMSSLRAIFKVKGDSNVTLLSQERISRAKKMMTPFVLRRRKDQVLKELPNKVERIEWCEMTDIQRSIYTDALQRSRKTICEAPPDVDVVPAETLPVNGKKPKKQAKPGAKAKKVYMENSSNVLMDLRKAASHPMLFRKRFTDDILGNIAKQLLKEPDFKKRGAVYDLVVEDMSVMTDAELQVFCATYKSTRKYLQDTACYVDAGKIQVLLRLLTGYKEEQRKVLVFSQFTQILDILQAVLKDRKIQYLLLTGSTPVDVRQSLVDEFTEDESISVFLLSTKAGGMGINLTAASVVIMFDQDFNPHNDRQAQDRAYRIGQKRDVDVVKLISRGTIEEDMLRLGQTKLALDEAVAGDMEDKGDSEDTAPAREMKISLMNTLRNQFEKQEQAPNGAA